MENKKEYCGVVGAVSDINVVNNIYCGMIGVQHRGQESAGIATSDGQKIFVVKDKGLVQKVFNKTNLSMLNNAHGIGHVRYATSGSLQWENSQPITNSYEGYHFSLAHNGHIVNAKTLAKTKLAEKQTLNNGSDSEIVSQLIKNEMTEPSKTGFVEALKKVLHQLRGSFSLVILTTDMLIGLKDPNGFRPLAFGKFNNQQGYCFASETCGLDKMEATFLKELQNGEMVIVDTNFVVTKEIYAQSSKSLCSFEFVYFSSPASTINEDNIYEARHNIGVRLAEEHPAEIDFVTGVPDSGIIAAQAYAETLNVPYKNAIVKNNYMSRSFIESSDAIRSNKVNMKLSPVKNLVKNKNIVVIDDSIVRGLTTKILVASLRKAGAKTVHLRIASPPYKWPCYFGMDTSDESKLIAKQLTIDEIKLFVDADSLEYLSVDNLKKSVKEKGLCTACMTGEYPIEISS